MDGSGRLAGDDGDVSRDTQRNDGVVRPRLTRAVVERRSERCRASSVRDREEPRGSRLDTVAPA